MLGRSRRSPLPLPTRGRTGRPRQPGRAGSKVAIPEKRSKREGGTALRRSRAQPPPATIFGREAPTPEAPPSGGRPQRPAGALPLPGRAAALPAGDPGESFWAAVAERWGCATASFTPGSPR